ncbi:uncharacterized protein LOC111445260 isoform X1 [Cucurbita moschata]|uniref:Uncharacterized protein LOC111445260 isoform X1 n=1 Tax=Cucurbita moschata TaxID=3662 RepID=A0A6J1FLA2_CUCMO|nr:uncharacterized protein LOC111445260 isoform X1 [Cucurbita moschata]
MSNPRKEDSIASNANGDADRDNVEEFGESSRVGGVSSNVGEVSGGPHASTRDINLTERLTDILVDEGDGDLLLQQSDREDRVIRWLQALDMQVMGACRADERLKPLLKMTTSNDIAEDRLLAQLSQHFEPVEVGILARCFCIPLVSIRVGKIDKQGTLLCPTTARGNLNLMVLPSSDFRLSFIGDNGHVERLFTLSNRSSSAAITIDEIASDSSGRSFVIKANDQNTYFWCSEKSKLLGTELLLKMKDLLQRRPSIAGLTGISESRLGCFATRLRAYLVESTVANHHPASSADSHSSVDTTRELSHSSHFGQSSKSIRSRNYGSPAVKANSAHQGSLSPRLNSFKEGLPKTLLSLRDAAREKFRRRGDNLALDNHIATSSISNDVNSETQTGDLSCPLSPSNFLKSLGKLAAPTPANSSHAPCVVSPLFTPYYCWCPGSSSILQRREEPSQLPIPSFSASSLPPFPSLFPASAPSNLSVPVSPLNLVDSPSLDFPALFPDPLVRLPLKTSQQIPTFTPLFCDPIVHVPVIDVCSSGPGYLVSAGPTITTSIPPLHPKLVNPMLPATDVEKDARETLRLLISGSSQGNPQLMNVLPVVLTDSEANRSLFLTGSHGLYSNTRDIDAIANSIASLGIASLSGKSTSEHVGKRFNLDGLNGHPDDSSDSESSCSEGEDVFSQSHFEESKFG